MGKVSAIGNNFFDHNYYKCSIRRKDASSFYFGSCTSFILTFVIKFMLQAAFPNQVSFQFVIFLCCPDQFLVGQPIIWLKKKKRLMNYLRS